MFTSVDKAIIALVTPLFVLAGTYVPSLKAILTPELANALTLILTPLLVYVTPNKPAA